MNQKQIAKTIYQEGYYLVFLTGFNEGFGRLDPSIVQLSDIQIRLEDKNGNFLLSAISHYGSYGVEDNKWEIMPNHPPKAWHDSVRGYLSFSEVIKYINREIRLHIKNPNEKPIF